MKKLVVFSVLNGFIGAFLLKLMGDYFVSERFMKVELSDVFIIGNIVLLAILSSIGFVFVARKQSVAKIWGAFGIEIASAILFVIADLVLLTFGIPTNFFPVSGDDNPASGLLIIIFGQMFIALSLLLHIAVGVVLSILSVIRKHKEKKVKDLHCD